MQRTTIIIPAITIALLIVGCQSPPAHLQDERVRNLMDIERSLGFNITAPYLENADRKSQLQNYWILNESSLKFAVIPNLADYISGLHRCDEGPPIVVKDCYGFYIRSDSFIDRKTNPRLDPRLFGDARNRLWAQDAWFRQYVRIYFNGSIMNKSMFKQMNISELYGTIYFLSGYIGTSSSSSCRSIHCEPRSTMLNMILVEKDSSLKFILYAFDPNQGAGGGPSPTALTSNISIKIVR